MKLTQQLFSLFTLGTVSCQISFGGGGSTTPADTSCTTPHGKEGECVGLRKCPNILTLLRRPIPEEVIKYLRKSVCKFDGFLPDVCCPEEKPSFDNGGGGSVTTTTTPKPTTTTVKTNNKTPVDGGWSTWSPFGGCTKSCGTTPGRMERIRSCNNPEPEDGGKLCPGDTTDQRDCGVNPCAQDGKWSEWSEWSSCSQSCDGGENSRLRKCDNPAPSGGGTECEGKSSEVKACEEGTPCIPPVEIPTECGQTQAGANRIVKGTPARLNAWPWQAALGFTNPNTNEVDYLCGATLITERHVLTAAHCVRDDMVTVLLGDLILHNDTDGAKPEEYKVVKMITHEDYNPRSFENDIAIIEFDEGVSFKTGIHPACLPSISPSFLDKTFENEGVVVTGWGATEFRGPTANHLQQGIISVVSNTECKEKFKKFNNVEIGESKMCARDLRDEVDACQGDSGGPLVLFKRGDDRKYRFYLVGVVSFGYRCAVKGFPGVYTRVTEFDDWIRKNVNAQ